MTSEDDDVAGHEAEKDTATPEIPDPVGAPRGRAEQRPQHRDPRRARASHGYSVTHTTRWAMPRICRMAHRTDKLDRSSPRDEVPDQGDDGNDEQDVNQPAAHRDDECAKRPQHQQN